MRFFKGWRNLREEKFQKKLAKWFPLILLLMIFISFFLN